MKTTKINTSYEKLFLAHETLFHSLTLLINLTSLKNDVKNYSGLGLKIIGILLADLKYNTGTHMLTKKEFDLFFESLPTKLYNNKRKNRTWICMYTVAKNIEACINANAIVLSNYDKTPKLNPSIL